ncbi:transposase [Aquimarina sp. RZ0]|nr:transposase [Aquimarina sp. RZ0]
MFGLTTTHRFHLYSKPTDMRKGFNGLCGVIQIQLSTSPTNGSVYIFINKTRDKVKRRKGKLHMSYHWIHHAPIEGLVLFKYDPSRSETMLQEYNGTIQTDGYSGYLNLTPKGSIKLLACMAHARRYFENALDNDASRASYALEQIQKLYAIERKSRERSINSETRLRYRKLYAIPILTTLEVWLQQQTLQVLPKSGIGKAISYTLKL